MNTVTQRILDFNEGRLPEELQLKYGFMAENTFRFFRGTCHLFYEDLSKVKHVPKSPTAWLCGDLHLENFGSFKGDNRLVYFDMNDFDESILAPSIWELLRITSSIIVGFESLKIGAKKASNMAHQFLKSYAATLATGKANYIEPQTAKGIVCTFLQNSSKRKEKDLLKKRTELVDNKMMIIVDGPKHNELDPFLKRELMHHIRDWIMYNHDGPYNYEVIDVAFRVAGTGSVGLKRYVFLLQSLNTKKKFLLLDMKQAVPSSLAPYVSIKQPEWQHEAERIVSVQQRMQNRPPAHLSTTIFKDEAYMIQELQPVKDSIDFKLLRDHYRDMYQVIDDMGMLTASAQLRSSGRQGSCNADELIKFGQDTNWQQQVLDYAVDYAATVKKDYQAFMKDFKKGVFKVTPNP